MHEVNEFSLSYMLPCVKYTLYQKGNCIHILQQQPRLQLFTPNVNDFSAEHFVRVELVKGDIYVYS